MIEGESVEGSDEDDDGIIHANDLTWNDFPPSNNDVETLAGFATSQKIPEFHPTRPKGPNFANIRSILGHAATEVATADPLNIFRLFWNDAIFLQFLTSTNVYGRYHYQNAWKNVTIDEFKAFLSIILFLGISNTTSRDMVWNEKYGFKFVQQLMSESRFDKILRSWHFVDSTQVTAQQKADDPFWATSSLMKVLTTSFKHFFNPGQRIDIDEQCIGWKGRHKCRVYNPNKPEKFHLKIYAANDAETGYQIDCYFYYGSAEVRPEGVSATFNPVRVLMANGFNDQGFILFTDNWYSSLEVVRYLVSKGIHFVGTIKTNRSGLPKAGMIKRNERRQRGFMKQMRADIVHENGMDSVFLVAWQDRQPVHMLSTISSNIGQVHRWISERRENWQHRRFPQPAIISLYNSGMGGTDSIDQRLAYYRPHIKTKSWITKVLIHLLSLSVFNSFVIYRDLLGKRGDKKFLLKDYIKTLVDRLSESYLDSLRRQQAGPMLYSKKRKAWLQDDSRLTDYHFPVSYLPDIQTRNARLHSEEGRCMVCKSSCIVKCKSCEVFLCLRTTRGIPNCFERFHTQRDFEMPIAEELL